MSSQGAFMVEVDGKPRLNIYAVRAHDRFLADGYYLAHWKTLGAEEAARRTCEIFQHDVRGGRCDRCGAGAAEVRLEAMADGQGRNRHRP